MTFVQFRKAVFQLKVRDEGARYNHALMHPDDICELLSDLDAVSQMTPIARSGDIQCLGFVIEPGSLNRSAIRFHSPNVPMSKMVYAEEA